MTSDLFLSNFGHIVNAPNGVRRLRELVLYLAITGCLSRRVEGDSNAETIVESALKGKEHYFQARKIRIIKGKNVELLQASRRLPKHWKLVATGELLHLINGRAFTSNDWRTSGLPIVRIQNLNNANAPFNYFQGEVSEDHRIANGDMLISWSGTPGTSFGAFIWSGDDAVLNQHIFKVSIYSDLLDKEFLMMAINGSLETLIRGARGGVGLKHVTKGQVEALLLPIPPVEEQKRIVAKVNVLMALCDELHAQQQDRARRLPELSRAYHLSFTEKPTSRTLNRIFELGDVSPTDMRETVLSLALEGKFDTQEAEDEPAAELIVRISKERERLSARAAANSKKRMRAEMEGNSMLPASWVWCRLGDVVLEFRYGTSRHCDRNASGVPVLRIPNIQNGRVDSSDLKFTTMPQSEIEDLRLQEGDLLLIRSNGSKALVGRSAVVTSADERFVYAGYLIRARIPKGDIFSEYLHLALATRSVRDQIERPIRTTSGVKNINTTELSNLVIPLPPFAEQRRIVAIVHDLIALVGRSEAQQRERERYAELLATVCIASLLGTTFESKEIMNAPKTEIVSTLKLGKRPKPAMDAPLARLLIQNEGELPAKVLWQQSGVSITAFYQQLKAEIEQGWIASPSEAHVNVSENVASYGGTTSHRLLSPQI